MRKELEVVEILTAKRVRAVDVIGRGFVIDTSINLIKGDFVVAVDNVVVNKISRPTVNIYEV